jgi:hypothetical protein
MAFESRDWFALGADNARLNRPFRTRYGYSRIDSTLAGSSEAAARNSPRLSFDRLRSYVAWQRYQTHQDQRETQRVEKEKLEAAEQSVLEAVCRYPTGMNFDEIYQKIDTALRNGVLPIRPSASL